MEQPFANPGALLDFLEKDEPHRYVFRGQTRAYPGPMLPSGIRDRFTPFDTSSPQSKWAGISRSRSANEEALAARWRTFSLPTTTITPVDDGKTTWDMSEAAYQTGFREFFNQAHRQRINDLGDLLREGAIPGLATLIGDDLADLLCQQYGFTSLALDVTTDPSVALFFATHQAPFYRSVTETPHMGVVYRWPRERATVAQDHLLVLEDKTFHSLVTSFGDFVRESADLDVVTDMLVRATAATGRDKRLMEIVADGERRSLGSLRVPPGTFARSRMGQQHAALLWPNSEIVKPLMDRNEGDHAALVGNLLDTHQGECFQFTHVADARASYRLDKFVLWPGIRQPAEGGGVDRGLEVRHDGIEFEDQYLELMLRFFSSCSPCMIIMSKLLEPGNRKSIRTIGVTHGVVDLGYLMQPSDARVLVERSRTPGRYVPVPARRYVPEQHLKSFEAILADGLPITAQT